MLYADNYKDVREIVLRFDGSGTIVENAKSALENHCIEIEFMELCQKTAYRIDQIIQM